MASVPAISSVVLFAADADQTASFYRALVVPLTGERHEGGPQHLATELGDVHFAIYQAESEGRAPARRAAGSTFVGFYVSSLDEVERWLKSNGAKLLVPHEQMPWGCRLVFEDPDGRAVEINQRDHCAAV